MILRKFEVVFKYLKWECCTFRKTDENSFKSTNRPYAYDVTEGRPRVLGVKRSTATCAIAKHAASGPTPACHTAGPAHWLRGWELTRSASTTRARSTTSLDPPTWRCCYGDVTSMQKVYTILWLWRHTNIEKITGKLQFTDDMIGLPQYG